MRLCKKSSLRRGMFSPPRSSRIAIPVEAKALVLSRCHRIRKRPMPFKSSMEPNTAGATRQLPKPGRWRLVRIAATVEAVAAAADINRRNTQDIRFLHWLEGLEKRHLTNLSFSEVRRAVQALSSLYVERRDRIDAGSAFTGSGKRAAFAMYFAPLHFLLLREIVGALDVRLPENMAILDLGCG